MEGLRWGREMEIWGSEVGAVLDAHLEGPQEKSWRGEECHAGGG